MSVKKQPSLTAGLVSFVFFKNEDKFNPSSRASRLVLTTKVF